MPNQIIRNSLAAAALMGLCIIGSEAEAQSSTRAERAAREYLARTFPQWRIEFVAEAEAPAAGETRIVAAAMTRGKDRMEWTGCAKVKASVKICNYGNKCCRTPELSRQASFKENHEHHSQH